MASMQQETRLPVKRWEFDLDAMTKHHWAFWYYCRRLGDKCWVDKSNRKVHIEAR